MKKRLSHLDKHSQEAFFALRKALIIVGRSLRDLSPAHVSVKHYFELTDSRPIHHGPRRMARKHNEFIRMELDNLLDAGIFVSTSSLCSFLVVIASKKNGNLRLCFRNASLAC